MYVYNIGLYYDYYMSYFKMYLSYVYIHIYAYTCTYLYVYTCILIYSRPSESASLNLTVRSYSSLFLSSPLLPILLSWPPRPSSSVSPFCIASAFALSIVAVPSPPRSLCFLWFPSLSLLSPYCPLPAPPPLRPLLCFRSLLPPYRTLTYHLINIFSSLGSPKHDN